MKQSILVLLFYQLFIGLTSAQNLKFNQLNGPYGCRGGVLEGSDGYLYLPRIAGGFYQSANSGQNWEKILNTPGGMLGNLSIGGDGKLYISDQKKVFRSADHGIHWQNVFEIAHNKFFVFPNGEIVITNQNDSLLWSDDNGLNWKLSFPKYKDGNFWYNPYNDQLYIFEYSDIQNIIYVSSDHGKSWKLLVNDIKLRGIQNLVFSSDGSFFAGGIDQIFRSANQGVSWDVIFLSSPSGPAFVELSISKNGRLYMTQDTLNAYSDDRADHFTKISNEVQIPFFNLTPDSKNKLHAIRNIGSNYISNSEGLVWNLACNGIIESHVVEVEFLSENKLLCVTADGLFYSSNGGLLWDLIYNIQFPNDISRFLNYHNYIYPTKDGNWFLYDIKNLHYFSQSGSQHQLVEKIGITGNSLKFWINPYNKYLFCTTSNGIFRSKDLSGLHWEMIQDFKLVSQIHFTENGNTLIVRPGKTLLSTDQGDSFIELKNPLKSKTKYLVNSIGTIVASQDLKLFYSYNTGVNWDSTDLSNQFFPTLQLLSNDNIVFVDKGTGLLFMTKDFGKNFKQVSDDNISFSDDRNELYLSPGGSLYYAPDNDGLYKSNGIITANNDVENVAISGIFLYPNPYANTGTLQLSKTISAILPVTLDIFDQLGNRILSSLVTDSKLTLANREWKPGLYYYQIGTSNFDKNYSGKLIVK